MLGLAKIDSDQFVKIWHREHCARERGQALYKSIEWALVEGYAVGHILAVDDVPNYRSLFPHHKEIASQQFNTLTIPSFQGQPDDGFATTLKRIAILKGLDIVEQRQQEEDAWLRWRADATTYESKENKGLGAFIHDEISGLKSNPDFKRYPIHVPKPIDHFDEQ